MTKPIIVLDCDGVLLDYNLAYAAQWERVFGYYPKEKDPKGHFPIDRWDVPRFNEEMRQKWADHSDFQFWSTMKSIEGALVACQNLVALGYDLVCVTALDPVNLEARKKNLFDLGFPLKDVIATGRVPNGNPKADTVNQLNPIWFVDDHLPYFDGVHPEIERILITRGCPTDTGPNSGSDLDCVIQYDNLNDFVFKQSY